MTKRSLLKIVALSCALALGLVGCSSGGKTKGDSGGGSGSAGDLIPFKVAQSTHSIAYFPLNVAEEMDFFKKEGLKVGHIPALGGDSKVAAALGGGSIDAGGGVLTDFFNLQKAGIKSAAVAALVNAFYVDIMVGKDFHAPASGSLDDKIRALKGAKIGVPAPKGGGEAFLNYLFSQVGMTTQDITLVNLGGSGTGAVAALKTHRVDALDFPQPVGQEVVAQGAGSIYISPARGDIAALKGQAHGAVLALTSDIKKKPEAFKRFVRAIADAESYIHDASASSKVQSLFASYAGIKDQAVLKAVYDIMLKEIPSTPEISQAGYATAVKFHQKAGLISGTPPSYATATDDDFAGKALSGQSNGATSPSPSH